MDNHIYASVAELKAEIADEGADPHRKAAAALFGKDPADIGLNSPERRWGKYLNMITVTGMSEYALADLALVPLESAREMLARYRSAVLA